MGSLAITDNKPFDTGGLPAIIQRILNLPSPGSRSKIRISMGDLVGKLENVTPETLALASKILCEAEKIANSSDRASALRHTEALARLLFKELLLKVVKPSKDDRLGIVKCLDASFFVILEKQAEIKDFEKPSRRATEEIRIFQTHLSSEEWKAETKEELTHLYRQ